MSDPFAVAYSQMAREHFPQLFKFVVPIAHEHENGSGAECVGSGVLVHLRGRHFVATARHCIQRNPRVLRRQFATENGRMVNGTPVRVLATGWHDVLDIGFLELAEPFEGEKEVQEGHLCFDPILEGTVHIIGFPVHQVRFHERSNATELQKHCFGTDVIEQTATRIKLDYPRMGYTANAAGDDWVDAAFIKTPHGFSGGGCFGVSITEGQIHVLQYKLLGIQYRWDWDDTSRWVEAVPIKQWYDMMMRHLRGA